MNGRRKNQRGIALAAVAIFLLVIFGFAAVGIDIARLAHTATEVQTVADSAARAGAVALAAAGGSPAPAIQRAHDIAQKNFMNADAAAPADVPVDTGFLDPATGNFQCCAPKSSPCCTGNASMGDWSCVNSGIGDCTKPKGAVLAMPATVVDNILAGIFDFVNVNNAFGTTPAVDRPNANTTVEKVAVAAMLGPTQGCQKPDGCALGDWQCYCSKGVAPCLPIAAPSCRFPQTCNSNSCLPPLTVGGVGVSSTADTAAWTAYGSSNVNDIRAYLDKPALCPQPGSGNNIPTEDVGNNVNIMNGGSGSSTWVPMQCIFDNSMGCSIDSNGKITAGPGRVFSLPIFDMGTDCAVNMNQQWPLIGFATIRIDSMNSRAPAPKVLNITTLANTSATGGNPGSQCFGTNCQVVLVH